MTRRIIHVHLDVRGALLNWEPHEWEGVITDDDGRRLSAREGKARLLDELAKGNVVLPVGEACPGFDPTGGGCPGHDQDEWEAAEAARAIRAGLSEVMGG